uniref:Uncharacterized protein n=1 Tax=Arundo donax TaxID=35708 RepID=A0A0A9FPW2_ARUDO
MVGWPQLVYQSYLCRVHLLSDRLPKILYLYFSIMRRASSTGSSDALPPASSTLEPEASFGFIARKPRYISPIIASTKNAADTMDLRRKRATDTAAKVTPILAIGLGTEPGTRLVPAFTASLPTLHAV